MAEFEYRRLQKTRVDSTAYYGIAPFSFVAILVPGVIELKEIYANTISVMNGCDYQAIEIRGPEFRDKIFFLLGPKKLSIIVNGWETDAKIVIFRHRGDDQLISVSVADASFLVQNSFNFLNGPTSSTL